MPLLADGVVMVSVIFLAFLLYSDSDAANSFVRYPPQACTAGQYSSAPALTTCTSCLPGQFSAAGSTACTACAPGTFLAQTLAAATSATAATQKTGDKSSGTNDCSSCTGNTWILQSTGPNAATGASCAICAAGYYGDGSTCSVMSSTPSAA